MTGYWEADPTTNPYIELNLIIPHFIFAIETEGHGAKGFIFSYSAQISSDCVTFTDLGVSRVNILFANPFFF